MYYNLIDEILYSFDLEFDKLDTYKRLNLNIPQKIIILNRAQRNVVLRKYGQNNVYGKGFEEIQKRIQELQRLIVPFETLPAISSSTNSFTVDLSTLSNELLMVARSTSKAVKNNCEDYLDNREKMNIELNDTLRDEHNKPSFEFRETVVTYAENKMYIYTDTTFNITSADITYLRFPVNMDKTGYTHFNGDASTDVTSELPVFLVDEIISTAVRLASKITENTLLDNLEKELSVTIE